MQSDGNKSINRQSIAGSTLQVRLLVSSLGTLRHRLRFWLRSVKVTNLRFHFHFTSVQPRLLSLHFLPNWRRGIKVESQAVCSTHGGSTSTLAVKASTHTLLSSQLPVSPSPGRTRPSACAPCVLSSTGSERCRCANKPAAPRCSLQRDDRRRALHLPR